ncbi:MAG: hypothetical protein K1X64_05780 [Myxococcaceae bacterium]|nr:hypothetical protein [Myxococcaceae bacterium]
MRLLKVDPSKLELNLVPSSKNWLTTNWLLEVKVDGRRHGLIPYVHDDGSGGMFARIAENLLKPHRQVIEDAKQSGQLVTVNLDLLKQYSQSGLSFSDQFHGQYGLIDRVRPNGATVLPPPTATYLDSRGTLTANAKDVKLELVHFIYDMGIAVYVKGELKGHVDLGDLKEPEARAYRMNRLETLLEKAQSENKTVRFNFDINDSTKEGRLAGLRGHYPEAFMQYDGMALPNGVKAMGAETADHAHSSEASASKKLVGGGLGAAGGCAAGAALGMGLFSPVACALGAIFGGASTSVAVGND